MLKLFCTFSEKSHLNLTIIRSVEINNGVGAQKTIYRQYYRLNLVRTLSHV